MPMFWRRVIDTSAFLLSVLVAVWMRYGHNYGWLAAIGCALIVFMVTPFAVSRLLGVIILRRMERKLRDRK